MLSGAFGNGLALPFGVLPVLLVLLAAGAWAGQLGAAELWRIPAAVLAGLAIGVALPRLGLALPQLRWLVIGAVILAGVLAAAPVQVPGWLAAVLGVAVAVPIGLAALASARPVLGWAGCAVGAVLGLSAGVGLTSIAGQALPGRGQRTAGMLAVLGGVWLLAETA